MGLTLAEEPSRDVRGVWRVSTPQEAANWYAAATPGAKQLYEKKMAEWKQAVQQAKATGKPEPPQPPAPANADFMHRAASLYNGMIAPMAPYAIRGAIWYQGETNASRADQYRRLFPTRIRDWRATWGQGDFPFLFVQIAPLDTGGAVDRVELRDAQREALAVPNTAMVVTLDIGDPKDEHPKNKQEVGRRLAIAAQKLAYGHDVIWSGPLYRDMKVQGNVVRIGFNHANGGLVAKEGRLAGFAIAGEDRQFVPAEARIVGATVVVRSAGVMHPVAVRFGWADFPIVDLWNKAGLPASGTLRHSLAPNTTLDGNIEFGVYRRKCGEYIVTGEDFLQNKCLVYRWMPEGPNLGFERPELADGAEQTNPAGAAWTFEGASGLFSTGSQAAGRLGAASGRQGAFLRKGGWFYRAVPLDKGGRCAVSFRLTGDAAQQVEVQLDNRPLGTFASGPDRYVECQTSPETIEQGGHVIKFVAAGEGTALLDDVRIIMLPPPPPTEAAALIPLAAEIGLQNVGNTVFIDADGCNVTTCRG